VTGLTSYPAERTAANSPGSSTTRFSECGHHVTVDVGARGHGSFKDLVLGSVSSHCVHHATCTVVVVRPNDGNNENGELT